MTQDKTKPKIVKNAAGDTQQRKIFDYFKAFIGMPEFGLALRAFITPKKVPGLIQNISINPQMINVANARDHWTGEAPVSSDWVVTEEAKLPLGIYVDEAKIITYAPLALPTLLPRRMVWLVEFMPVVTDDAKAEEHPSAALRFRYRCGGDKWTELVSEPIVMGDEPVRFGFEIPMGSVRMNSLFECLMGVTPMTDTPVIVRAAWLNVSAFE